MITRHFKTRAEIERQMVAARQLRSEMLAGASRILVASSGAAMRQALLRIAARAPGAFPSADRPAPGVDGPRS